MLFCYELSKVIIGHNELLFLVADFLLLFLFAHVDASLSIERSEEVIFGLPAPNVAHQILHVVDLNGRVLIFWENDLRGLVDVGIALNFLFFLDDVDLFLVDGLCLFGGCNLLGVEVADIIPGEEVAHLCDEEHCPDERCFYEKIGDLIDGSLVI